METPAADEVLDPRDPEFVAKATLQQVLYGRTLMGPLTPDERARTIAWVASQPEVVWADGAADPARVWTRRQPRRFWQLRARLRRMFTLACEPMHDVFGDDDDVAASGV